MPSRLESGLPRTDLSGMEDYGDMTADFLLEQMQSDEKVVVITSGTLTVMGFTPDKRALAGRQFVDVGITEEHAVALASGIATGGCKPVYRLYSTFIDSSTYRSSATFRTWSIWLRLA